MLFFEERKMSEQKFVNGVNVDQLFGTIDTIKQQPEIAKFKFRATNKWVNGGHNTTTIKDFYGAGQEDTTRTTPFVLQADEPPVLLGEDKGANPVEYLLAALAGCLTTSMVYHAAAQGIKIESVESSFEELACALPCFPSCLDWLANVCLFEDGRQGHQDTKESSFCLPKGLH